MSTTTTTFEWDEQNNLSAMTLPGGSREEYVYSADGLRRQKKVNGTVTHYIWDEQNLLQEKDALLQTQVQYTTQPHGYGPVLSQRRFGGTSQQSAQFNAVGFGSSQSNQGGSSPAVPKSTFYGTDMSGNVRNLTDSSGAVTDRYVTTAFGKPVSSTGSTTNPYRFGGSVGYYQDNAQQYYVRKRYLDTNQARWISPDPIGFNGRDWNLFRYVGNNPITLIDPSGNQVIGSFENPYRYPNEVPYGREGYQEYLNGDIIYIDRTSKPTPNTGQPQLPAHPCRQRSLDYCNAAKSYGFKDRATNGFCYVSTLVCSEALVHITGNFESADRKFLRDTIEHLDCINLCLHRHWKHRDTNAWARAEKSCVTCGQFSPSCCRSKIYAEQDGYTLCDRICRGSHGHGDIFLAFEQLSGFPFNSPTTEPRANAGFKMVCNGAAGSRSYALWALNRLNSYG